MKPFFFNERCYPAVIVALNLKREAPGVIRYHCLFLPCANHSDSYNCVNECCSAHVAHCAPKMHDQWWNFFQPSHASSPTAPIPNTLPAPEPEGFCSGAAVAKSSAAV